MAQLDATKFGGKNLLSYLPFSCLVMWRNHHVVFSPSTKIHQWSPINKWQFTGSTHIVLPVNDHGWRGRSCALRSLPRSKSIIVANTCKLIHRCVPSSCSKESHILFSCHIRRIVDVFFTCSFLFTSDWQSKMARVHHSNPQVRRLHTVPVPAVPVWPQCDTKPMVQWVPGFFSAI